MKIENLFQANAPQKATPDKTVLAVVHAQKTHKTRQRSGLAKIMSLTDFSDLGDILRG